MNFVKKKKDSSFNSSSYKENFKLNLHKNRTVEICTKKAWKKKAWKKERKKERRKDQDPCFEYS